MGEPKGGVIPIVCHPIAVELSRENGHWPGKEEIRWKSFISAKPRVMSLKKIGNV
jgi:hypothetical protein